MHFVHACMLLPELNEPGIRARACISYISEHTSLINRRLLAHSVIDGIALLSDSLLADPSRPHSNAPSSVALISFRPTISSVIRLAAAHIPSSLPPETS